MFMHAEKLLSWFKLASFSSFNFFLGYTCCFGRSCYFHITFIFSRVMSRAQIDNIIFSTSSFDTHVRSHSICVNTSTHLALSFPLAFTRNFTFKVFPRIAISWTTSSGSWNLFYFISLLKFVDVLAVNIKSLC